MTKDFPEVDLLDNSKEKNVGFSNHVIILDIDADGHFGDVGYFSGPNENLRMEITCIEPYTLALMARLPKSPNIVGFRVYVHDVGGSIISSGNFDDFQNEVEGEELVVFLRTACGQLRNFPEGKLFIAIDFTLVE